MKLTRAFVLMLAAAVSACAGPLLIVFDNAALSGAPGDTLAFFGVLANSGTDPFFLNGPEVTGLDPSFAPDVTPFFLSTPLSIDPGANGILAGVEFFDVVIPVGQASGDYSGLFTIIGGADSAAQDMFSTALFTVSVTNAPTAAPEPGTGWLVSTVLLALCLGGRLSRKILDVVLGPGSISLAIAATVFAQAAPSQPRATLTPTVREVVRNGGARVAGRLPADRVMSLHVVLPLRDPAALDSFLRDVYDPASSSYRHFLTVPEFTAKFGPSQEDFDALVSFAKDNGFTVAGGSRDGMQLQIEGAVSTIEAAFHISMLTYQHPEENRVFYSPDREPTVDLPFNLLHIGGLDNYTIPRPLLVKRSDYARAHGIEADRVVSHATTGSGPSAAFLGSDMRAAYYGGTLLTGAGQSLGLFEFGGTDLADVNTYYKNIGQTNKVPITLFSTDGTSTQRCPTCDDIEQTIDITQALGMAPGLSSLVVYVGSNPIAIVSAMTTHNPLPATIGCSWFFDPDPGVFDPYFQRMAAQGQSFFVASGDNSTWSSTTAAWPAEDAWVIAVGGTDLVTAGAGGPWASETAWAGSGGGISPEQIAIPPWQQHPGVINSSNGGSLTYRNGPDVAANANFTFYTCSHKEGCQSNTIGGTSFAAPMWAGYAALVNQQVVSHEGNTIGFINPVIYAQNTTANYARTFHDITIGQSGSYSAVTGYDLVTGWGSPRDGVLGASVPYVIYDVGTLAVQAIEKAGLVPKVTGTNVKGAWVNTQSPLQGQFVPFGSTVTIVLRPGPVP